MSELKNLEPGAVKDRLSLIFDMAGSVSCPVPGCTSIATFSRWGDMRGHFLDSTTHKRDYFKAYERKAHKPFSEPSGPGFNHGVCCLMLALFEQPTSLEALALATPSRKPKTTYLDTLMEASEAIQRPKKVRPRQEQQELPTVTSEAPDEAPAVKENIDSASRMPNQSSLLKLKLQAIQDAERNKTTLEKARSQKSAFSQISEEIRTSDPINKVWRAKAWDHYVDIFHGIPPCFHCRSEEGKQIHHQNPLFHEIILISLNKLGTTAEVVLAEKELGNQTPYDHLLNEVSEYHMVKGKVLAVPYCQSCNQDAEAKRRKGRS